MNEYDVVTFYGNQNEAPWANPDLPLFIGNELRQCHFVGFQMGGFTFPDTHVITAWGDDGGEEDLSTNATRIKVTDSDDEFTTNGSGTNGLGTNGPDVATYGYNRVNDDWYLPDYDVFDPVFGDQNPYIMHVATLSPPDTDCGGGGLRVVGSYRIRQDAGPYAMDLHYKVGVSDARICSYDTTLDWVTADVPQIVKYHESASHEYLNVDWEFEPTNGVPPGTDVTITTEFVLPGYNQIYYEDVYFTYASPPLTTNGPAKPSFGWTIDTAGTGTGTGHYVVGAFELYDASCTTHLGDYRFQHEYDSDQDPEHHTFHLESRDGTEYCVKNLNFGHTWHRLTTSELWGFDSWLQQEGTITLPGSGSPITVLLNFEGALPIPTVSEWGAVIMGLLLLTAGGLVIQHRRRRPANG